MGDKERGERLENTMNCDSQLMILPSSDFQTLHFWSVYFVN